MTEHEFEARWKQIQDQKRAEKSAVEAKWSQIEARLCLDSGLSQRVIARKIGMCQSHVNALLCFARFLRLIATGDHLTHLTERRFRKAWVQTSGTVEDRCAATLKILEAGFVLDAPDGRRKKPAKKKDRWELLDAFYAEAMNHLREARKLADHPLTTYCMGSIQRHIVLLQRLFKELREKIEK